MSIDRIDAVKLSIKKTGKPSWNAGKTLFLTKEQLIIITDLLNSNHSLRKIEKIINISRHIISRELKNNKLQNLIKIH